METKEELFGSNKGKLWGEAVEKAMSAPFPEVAIQHLLRRVHQRAKVEVLEELLSRKWLANNEREAILKTNMGIGRVEDALSEPVNIEERRLQYVKVLDVETLLSEAKEVL